MDNCIKILIADADEGFTSDLACYLKTNSSFDVVGAANDGERAVRLLRAAQPNVLILDLLLPKLDGTGHARHKIPERKRGGACYLNDSRRRRSGTREGISISAGSDHDGG